MKDDVKFTAEQRAQFEALQGNVKQRRRSRFPLKWPSRIRIPTGPVATRTVKHVPGLTVEQREHYDDLQGQCEDLRDQFASESERKYWIEPELKRIEAELNWIHLDLLYFGGWLQDGEKQPSRRGRPIDPEIVWRDKRIAAHSLLLEAEGIPNKIMIATIAELYHVSRSTAFAAREHWCPQLREFGYDRCSPQKRRRRIDTFETLCSDPLLQSK